MKIRNYEKYELIVIFSILFFLLLILFIIFVFKYKLYSYQTFKSFIVEENNLSVIVTKKEKATILKNSSLYLENKKIKYSILTVTKLTESNNDYYQLLLKVKLKKKYEPNDLITFEIQTGKIRVIEIFKVIWESD